MRDNEENISSRPSDDMDATNQEREKERIMDDFMSPQPETHVALLALSDIATFRTHENRTVLDLAESFIEDYEPSEEDRRVLREVRDEIDKILGIRPHADVLLERIEHASAAITRKGLTSEQLLHVQGYDQAMAEIRAVLVSETRAIDVTRPSEEAGLHEMPESEMPESTRE